MNDANGIPTPPPDEAPPAEKDDIERGEQSPPEASVPATEPVAADDVPGEATMPATHPVRDDEKMVLPAQMRGMDANPGQSDAEVEAQMKRMSRRSFLWGAVALGAGYTGWRWLISRRQEDGVVWPLRRALQTNEELARDYFRDDRLAPTFAASEAGTDTRVNGDLGLGDDFDPKTWKLHVEGLGDENNPSKTVTLAQIKALPRVEMVTELKCIEGWSVIVHWAGARLSDFMRKYPPATTSGDAFSIKKPDDLPPYVGMSTPDGGYYVGLDMEAALHPQTLLCYEMDGKPLTLEHGAPLRLAIPVKYGIKNIKRIGTINYVTERPADYWAEQGYDYYAGH